MKTVKGGNNTDSKKPVRARKMRLKKKSTHNLANKLSTKM